MSKKNKKSEENKKSNLLDTNNESSISHLMDEVKSGMFHFDDSIDFIEDKVIDSSSIDDSSINVSNINNVDEIKEEVSQQVLDEYDSDALDELLFESQNTFASEVENEEFKSKANLEEALDQQDVVEDTDETKDNSVVFNGSELESFESVEIEELDFVSDEQLQSTIESILFASDRPVSLASIKQVFQGTNVNNSRIKHTLENLKTYYAAQISGVTLEDVGSGYQLRTKLDNMEFLKKSLKAKPFKLSGPALEVLAIVAYKQPTVKNEIDQIRGVESGHLLRALMEKNLVHFAGKSDLPGKPMQYVTSRKFLEIFSLRNLKELPTLSQIDELLPEGIGEEEIAKPKLHDITDDLSQKTGTTYSEGEEELNKITDQLQAIETSSDFFEKEKIRQKEQKELEKAQNIKEALAVGEEVSSRDKNWLKKYEEKLLNPEPTTSMTTSTNIFSEVSDSLNYVEENEVENSKLEVNHSDDIDDIPSWSDPEITEANDIADIES